MSTFVYRLALLAAVVPPLFVPVTRAEAREKPLTLVAVGDVNLNRTRLEVREDGIYLWGKVVPFSKMFEGIREHVDGDVNFCNLETTVMDRNDIAHADKAYNFRCHPNAVRAALKAGFNLMSIANNHMKDYGPDGIKETVSWLKKLGGERKDRKLRFAGAGKDIDEASKVAVFKVNGIRVAFAAISISTRATGKRAGVASVYKPEPALSKLKAAEADIRILSMHAGDETKSKPNRTQLHVARNAIRKYDVDIVLGHHAHVVQGVEHYRNGLIFYGLGNFAMRGARNMGSVKEFKGERDFGLLVKVEMAWDTRKKKVVLKKAEALPVYDMHSGPHPFNKDDQARKRIEALNRFSTSGYLGKGQGGLSFTFENGRGVYLFGKEKEADGKSEDGKKKKVKKKKVDKKKVDKKKVEKKKVEKKKEDGRK